MTRSSRKTTSTKTGKERTSGLGALHCGVAGGHGDGSSLLGQPEIGDG
jgi:hypothetical protein